MLRRPPRSPLFPSTTLSQSLHDIIATCRLIEMPPEHHDKKGAGETLGNGRSPGPATLELFIDGLHEHAHPMERLSRAQAEHDRRGQRGNDQIVGRGMELQAAAD